MTIAFGCLVILRVAVFILSKTIVRTAWWFQVDPKTTTLKVSWFQVHGKVLGWEIGEGNTESRYNISLMPITHAIGN